MLSRMQHSRGRFNYFSYLVLRLCHSISSFDNLITYIQIHSFDANIIGWIGWHVHFRVNRFWYGLTTILNDSDDLNY